MAWSWHTIAKNILRKIKNCQNRVMKPALFCLMPNWRPPNVKNKLTQRKLGLIWMSYLNCCLQVIVRVNLGVGVFILVQVLSLTIYFNIIVIFKLTLSKLWFILCLNKVRFRLRLGSDLFKLFKISLDIVCFWGCFPQSNWGSSYITVDAMSKLIIYLHHVCVIAMCIDLITNRLNPPLNNKNDQCALPRHKNVTQKLHDSLVVVHAKALLTCLSCLHAPDTMPELLTSWTAWTLYRPYVGARLESSRV